MSKKPSVVMIGLGYIGLPTAALIASKGIQVTGVDIDQNIVNTIIGVNRRNYPLDI